MSYNIISRMVRYYGRARQRTGSVNTNQPGLKQAGCPSTIGKRGVIVGALGRRVNCNLKTCGGPMSGLRCKYGVRDAIGTDKTFIQIQNSNNPAIEDYCHQVINKLDGTYCQWPQPKNRQLAGGVGNIWTARRDHCEQTCSLGWEGEEMLEYPGATLAEGAYGGDSTCLKQIYGPSKPGVNSLNFIYLSSTCSSLLQYFEQKSSAHLQNKKGNETPFPPSFPPLTTRQSNDPTLLIPKLYQPWYPLFYSMKKVAAINKYNGGDSNGGGTWNQLYADNLHGWKGLVEIANHGGRDTPSAPYFWWFYRAVGSGIFVDLGQNPLVAMNKAHALKRAYGGKGIPDVSCDPAPLPGGSYLNISKYLRKTVEQMENMSQTGTDPFKFGAQLSPTQWDDVKTHAHQLTGKMDDGDAFADIFSGTDSQGTPKYFTANNPSSDPLDILAHGVLGTSLSTGPVDIDCRLMQILNDPTLGYTSIQMLCQPNYQGGWATEILYKTSTEPTFYNAQDQVCQIPEPNTWPCLFCNQPSIDVGCNKLV